MPPAPQNSACLQALVQERAIDALDLDFAELLGRLEQDAPTELLAAAALVCHAAGAGHVCLPLGALAQRVFGAADPDRAQQRWIAPGLPQWLAALHRCTRTVGAPGAELPLILDHAGRLYLQRHWRAEQWVADAVSALAPAIEPVAAPAALRAALDVAFGATADDAQRRATATALMRRLTIVTGGPGTGKTTLLRKLLGIYRQFAPTARVLLAAPTGKAAARMSQVLAAAEHGAGAAPAAQTLHRALGRTATDGAAAALRYELVVVDEASMVDLDLMARLLRALPQRARLVLLGDRGQLASVQAGAVLADLCGYGSGRAATAPWRERLWALGCAVPDGEPASAAGAVLADGVVALERTYRYAEDSGIAALARAVNAGDGATALAVCGAGAADLAWHAAADTATLHARLYTAYAPLFAALHAGADPAAGLAHLRAVGVLCAQRAGPRGVAGINTAIERSFGLRDGWYPGRPVLITRNLPALGLANGDLGIAWPAADNGSGKNELRVWFGVESAAMAAGAGVGALRAHHPARLAHCQTAYATTVHKAQGTEFDTVIVVAPERDSPVLTRELLYTAITRARRRVELWATPAVLRTAIARRTARTSGLGERLWPASDL